MNRQLIPGAPGNEFVPNGHGGMVEVNSYYAARYKEITRLEDMLTSGVGPTGVTLDERAKSSISRQLEFLEDSLKHDRGPRKRQLVPSNTGNTGSTGAPATAEAVQRQIEKLENILELGVGPSGVPVDEDIKAAVLEEIDYMMKQIVEIRMYESQLDAMNDKRQLRHLPFPVNTDSAMEELGLGKERYRYRAES